MSVLNPIISSINGLTRRIYLKAGVSDYFPIEDLYHEYRRIRSLDTNSIRKYEPLIKAEGNVPKGGGAFTPRYVVLLDGTKIVPFNESLQINQLGDMITDNPDIDATLYDISGLTTAKPIFIKPSEAETIQLNSGSIEYSSFGGGVWVDQDNGVSGTDELKGNAQFPVNNIPDAVSICVTRGLPKTIFILGNLTIDTGDDVSGFQLIGQNPARTTLVVNDLSNTLNTAIKEVALSGFLDGNTIVRNCNIGNITYFSGEIHDSQLKGKITLGNNAQAFIINCASGVAGQTTPEIDFGGSGQSLVLSGYRQGVKFTNKTGEEAVSVSLDGGQVRIDLTTVNNGSIVARGLGRVVNDLNSDWLPHGNYGGLQLDNETTYGVMLQELWTAHGLDFDVPATSGTKLDNLPDEILDKVT